MQRLILKYIWNEQRNDQTINAQCKLILDIVDTILIMTRTRGQAVKLSDKITDPTTS